LRVVALQSMHYSFSGMNIEHLKISNLVDRDGDAEMVEAVPGIVSDE
jgi:hypothetical protein